MFCGFAILVTLTPKKDLTALIHTGICPVICGMKLIIHLKNFRYTVWEWIRIFIHTLWWIWLLSRYTGTLATGIEVQNKMDALLPNKRILYIFCSPHRYNGITTCNSDHRLQSITAAHIWELLTNTENSSQPFSHKSHRWPSNHSWRFTTTVYNHSPRFTIYIHGLQFGLQNKIKQN